MFGALVFVGTGVVLSRPLSGVIARRYNGRRLFRPTHGVSSDAGHSGHRTGKTGRFYASRGALFAEQTEQTEQAVLRRAPTKHVEVPEPTQNGWLQRDGLCLHVDRRIVEVANTVVSLMRSELDLLASLFQPGNWVHTKAKTILELRGDSFATGGLVTDSDPRFLEMHVANVRKKISRSDEMTSSTASARNSAVNLRRLVMNHDSPYLCLDSLHGCSCSGQARTPMY